MSTPVREGKQPLSLPPARITLRIITDRDIDTLMELTGNPEVIKYLPEMIQDREFAKKWIAGLTPDDHEYMILLGDAVIGECSLTVRGNSGEIGLMLFPEHWRQGYGTETAVLLMNMAKELGLQEVTAVTSPKNEAGVGLFRKLGFTLQGIGWMLNEKDFDKNLDQLFSTVLFHKTIEPENKQGLIN